jgi:hypothetical protein
MTAKEYLEQARKIRQEIVLLNEQIQTMFSEVASYHPIQLDDSGASHLNYREDKTAEKVAEILDLTDDMNDRLKELYSKEIEIRHKVLELKEPQEREVLILRYLTPHPKKSFAPLGWCEIGSRMNYTKQGVIKLHARALKHFAEIN